MQLKHKTVPLVFGVRSTKSSTAPYGSQASLLSRQSYSAPPKRLEGEHRTRAPFHRSLVLFHNTIEIFRVTDDTCGFVHLVVVRDRLRVTAALINGDLLRHPLGADGFV